MSDDAKSTALKGPRKLPPRPRVLVVYNRSPESSEDEKNVQQFPHQAPQFPNSSQPRIHDVPTPPLPPHLPPLNVDMPEQSGYPSSRSNHSNPALSSPSSTSDPAVESTPPPSTPGQSNPPVDLIGESTLRPEHYVTSPDRNDNSQQAPSRPVPFFESHRPPAFLSSGPRPLNRPATSPTVSYHDSYTSPTNNSHRASPSERVTFLVTADAETLRTVDITGATDAACIRERIFTKLQIPDEDQPRFSIYRTEIGAYAIGEALSDDQLFDLYRNGDARGSVKLLVSFSHARVHEQSMDSLASPTINTIPPPPVLPHHVYQPLRPRKSKSRRGSLSSASERMPQEVAAAGYEASVSDDLDQGDRESRRSTIRPPPQQSRARSPAASRRPQTPPTVLSPNRPQVQSPDSQTQRERPFGSALPTPPLPPSNSPLGSRFHEDTSPGPPQQWHNRSCSDAAAERERVMQAESQYDQERHRRLFQEREERDREDRERMRPRDHLPRREQAVKRLKAQHDRDMSYKQKGESWSLVPPNVPSSGYKKERPEQRPSHSPRFGGNGNFPIALPHPPRGPPPTPPSKRPTGKTVPSTWMIGWMPQGPGSKAESKPIQSPGTAPWSKMMSAKSVGDLRSAYKQQQPQVPSSLQPGAGRGVRQPSNQLPIAKSAANMSNPSMNGAHDSVSPSHHDGGSYSELGLARSYETSNNSGGSPVPPLHNSRQNNSSGYSTGSSTTTSPYLGLTSPNQEPYPRPRSALGGDPSLSPYRPNRQLQSPRATDFTQELPRPPPSPSSHRYSPGVSSAISSTPTHDTTTYSTPLSSGSHFPRTLDGYSRPDILAGIESLSQGSYPPHSPVNMTGPQSEAERRTAEPMQRTLSSNLPVQEDDESTTIRREDYPRYATVLDRSHGAVVQSNSTTLMPTNRSMLPPTPEASQNAASSSATATLIDTSIDDDSDSDGDGGGTIWAKKPNRLPPWPQTSNPKPLNNSRPVLAPISTDSSPSSGNTALPTNLPAVPNYTPPPLPQTRRGPRAARSHQDQRTSRFDNNVDNTWAPRPPPEEVFEKLQEYFPEHDIDEPVIEAQSGGTSPTSAELPNFLPPANKPFRHKKSIRVVAAEHKRKVDRYSRMESSSVQASIRKRNTKLWGSRLEEVTSDQGRNDTNIASEPSPGAKPIFRWVRGEMIGKGTYGKVYLALNATTGEMIAVKQVEIPRTASDKNDARQVTVVEALKLESETLKDLDHPNIVQYLGFEETPTFLSIFLEYVPGGSIASCLRKHGRFDEEVTKSFTGQILSGLEYLHSKGILHRDLKADNILVETSGICKISDFGISKRTDDINMAAAYTSMQGTVFWMAPEVVHSQKSGYNSKIDIWSVGCVVFEMWTGERPWKGQEAMVVLLHLYQTREGPPVPKEITLSPLADNFRQLCFAMNPDERPSAAELRNHPYLELQPDWTFNGFK